MEAQPSPVSERGHDGVGRLAESDLQRRAIVDQPRDVRGHRLGLGGWRARVVSLERRRGLDPIVELRERQTLGTGAAGMLAFTTAILRRANPSA
jgi:hypothetical protein